MKKKKSDLGDASQSLGPRASGLAVRSVGETPDQALQPAIAPAHEEPEEVPMMIFQIECAQKRLRDLGYDLNDFDVWLRTQCFQAPTQEAHDLAKSAWNFRACNNHYELLEQLKNLVGLARMGSATIDKYLAALQDAETVIAKAEP